MPANLDAQSPAIRARSLPRPSVFLTFGPAVLGACIYFFSALFSATHHKFWFDEVNTALLGHLSLPQLWQGLAAGADTNPPLLYLPVHLLDQVTSNAELACRLPSILEFFLMMVAIYAIIARYVSPLYALLAAFIPFLTIAGSYAIEGRGYAATLGFSAAALLCWRNAAVLERRSVWLLGLPLSSAAALGTHYSAALILTALGGGEAVRVLQRKRIDWPVAFAIAAGAAPLVMCRPLMGAIHRYLVSYWAKPSIQEVMSSLAGWKLAGLLIAGLTALHIFQLVFRRGSPPPPVPGPAVPLYEAAAWLILLLSPVQGYLQGLVTGGFTMRYALPMAIPIAIFTGLYAFRVLRGSALPALIILALLLGICAERFWIVTVRPIVFQAEADWIEKQLIPASGPVVIGNGVVFSPLYFYAKEPLRSRLAYVCGPDLSTKYLHMNSPDLNLSELRKFSPMPVFDYDVFIRSNRRFTLAMDQDSWLPRKLRDDNIPIKQLVCQGAWCIYDVQQTF